jgi:antitoxin (DNA-binding transcriptional repressor) of toxin-antitoxin stability system
MTFLELRRDPRRLLEAIENREEVTLSRRGKDIARITPLETDAPAVAVHEHDAFGIWSDDKETRDPARRVRQLRKGRFHDL